MAALEVQTNDEARAVQYVSNGVSSEKKEVKVTLERSTYLGNLQEAFASVLKINL